MFPLNNRSTLDPALSLLNTDRKSKEPSIRTNISLIDQDEIINSSPLLTSNRTPLRYVHEKSETFSEINDIHIKQNLLEEKINNIQNEMITHDLINTYKKQIKIFEPLLSYTNCLDELKAKLDFFRISIWRLCSDTHNWKLLAQSIYYVERLINNLDNHQIKEFIQKQFKIILNEFILFVKDLITKQIKLQKDGIKDRMMKENESSRINDTDVDIILSPKLQEINPTNQHLQNVQSHFSNLKELILTAHEHFHMCRTDIDATQTLLKAIDDINFSSQNFDKPDQDKIRLLALKQDISQKSNKNDLIQLKIYIDNQIKKLIELNKQNAKELERIKLAKTATSEGRHIQRILSHKSSIHHKQQNRIYSHQSSRPYITFDLDHIRKYQQQALLKSPYGTIPLYRRQAWAAANLLQDHPLHLLRYMQNSLRMQIHYLIGYDPADIYSICNKDKNKNRQKKKKKKSSNDEIFHHDQDLLIVGNDNKLYRGRINSCEIIPLKKSKKEKEKSSIDENNEIKKLNIDQLDQTTKTIADEHLFEYLDWQTQFNEQDLPDELCEELFNHWKSIICEEQQPCICPSQSNLLRYEEEDNEEHRLIKPQIDSSSSSSNNIYDDRCICSDCSCQCEKYNEDDSDQSICLCSQCSCKCLKDFQTENQDNKDNINETENNQQDYRIDEISVNNELPLSDDVVQTDHVTAVESMSRLFIADENNEANISDCFMNRVDQWTKQFDIFHGNYKLTSLLEENDWSTMNDIPPTVTQFQTAAPIAFESNNISINTTPPELDDPTAFRQQLLDHHRRQHEQTNTNHEQQDQTYVDNTGNQQVYLQPNRRRIHRRELNNNTSLNLFESKPIFLKRKY